MLTAHRRGVRQQQGGDGSGKYSGCVARHQRRPYERTVYEQWKKKFYIFNKNINKKFKLTKKLILSRKCVSINFYKFSLNTEFKNNNFLEICLKITNPYSLIFDLILKI